MAKIIRNGVLYGSNQASDINYSNTSSGLTATAVQGAIDEVNTNIGDLSTLDTTEKGSAVGAINEINQNLSNKADKTMLSNRNLLDNPFFTINSRGKTEYTDYGYTVDRWRNYYADKNKVKYLGSGIEFSGISDIGYNTFQKLDDEIVKSLRGKTITISADVSGADSNFILSISNGTTNEYISLYSRTADRKIISKSGEIPNDAVCIDFILQAYSTSIATIHSVKLELGSVSTLAMDVAPNYQEELIKCMTSTADANDTYANKTVNISKEITASLAANQTSLTISNSAITTSSTIDVYTTVFGVNPTNITVTSGQAVLTFDSTHNAATIKLRVS